MLWWASNEGQFHCNYGSWTPTYSIVKYACWKNGEALRSHKLSLREKCPDTEFFQVRVFLHSDWIWDNTDQKKICIWTLFTQCLLQKAELAIRNFFIKFEQIRRKQYEKFQGKFLRNRESWLMISSITIYSSARSSGHHQSV